MTFYERFVDLCKSNDMSPSAVVKALGLNNSSSTAWKRGSIPKSTTLDQIADYFDTTVDYLLCRTDDPENSDRFGLNPPELWQTHSEDEFPDDEIWIEKVEELREQYYRAVEHGELHDRLDAAFSLLNPIGQQKAVERVEELTEIPRYRRQDVPPANLADQDTPSPEPPPESPENGG